MLLAPGEELRDGLGVRGAGIFVPDRCREEFDEAPGGGFTGAADRGRQVSQARRARDPAMELGRARNSWTGAFDFTTTSRNSSGSKKSAGSISAISQFVSQVPCLEIPRCTLELVRFERFFSSPDCRIITSFMIRPAGEESSAYLPQLSESFNTDLSPGRLISVCSEYGTRNVLMSLCARPRMVCRAMRLMR